MKETIQKLIPTMPEVAEVRIVAEALDNILKKNIVLHIKILNEKYTKKIKGDLSSIKNEKIIRVESKGKQFRIVSESGKYIVFHLGMTGNFSMEKEKQSHIEIAFQDGKEQHSLFFNDTRRFGKVSLMNEEEVKKEWASIGFDILSTSFDWQAYQDTFVAWLKKTRSQRIIADVLLDQKVISGIGNYLRADILYDAKINPYKKAKELNPSELRVLYDSIRKVAIDSYISQGNTIRDYHSFGSKGHYICRIYNRAIDHEGNKVVREKLKGRMLHWAPKVQK